MAFTTSYEKYGERRQSVSGASRTYVLGSDDPADDDTAALNAVILLAPATIDGLVQQDADVHEVATSNGGDSALYTCGVKWGIRDKLDPQTTGDGYRISCRTSTSTAKLRASLATAASYNASWATAENFKGLVNVKPDGGVDGADVLVPSTVLSVSKVLAAATVTNAYAYATSKLATKTNAAEYVGYEIGTLLCTGVSIQPQSNSTYEVTAEFLVQENRTGLSIGDITAIAKGGHQYLWVYALERAGAKNVKPEPAQVNVETFYQTADFATVLGF